MSVDGSKDSPIVEIPEDVYTQVRSRVDQTDFNSTSEYVSYILEEVLYYTDRQSETNSGVDEVEVEDRLRSLGYLEE